MRAISSMCGGAILGIAFGGLLGWVSGESFDTPGRILYGCLGAWCGFLGRPKP